MILLYGFALANIIIGLILLIFIRHQRQQFGILNKGKRIYQDTKEKPGETIYAKTIRLVGKPDYIIEQNGIIIPVEFKSGKTPETPYLNHTMQLMAYCFLIEERFGKRPPGGYLRYPDKEFKLKYTDEAREAVKQAVTEILQNKSTNEEQQCKHAEHYF